MVLVAGVWLSNGSGYGSVQLTSVQTVTSRSVQVSTASRSRMCTATAIAISTEMASEHYFSVDYLSRNLADLAAQLVSATQALTFKRRIQSAKCKPKLLSVAQAWVDDR